MPLFVESAHALKISFGFTVCPGENMCTPCTHYSLLGVRARWWFRCLPWRHVFLCQGFRWIRDRPAPTTKIHPPLLHTQRKISREYLLYVVVLIANFARFSPKVAVPKWPIFQDPPRVFCCCNFETSTPTQRGGGAAAMYASQKWILLEASDMKSHSNRKLVKRNAASRKLCPLREEAELATRSWTYVHKHLPFKCSWTSDKSRILSSLAEDDVELDASSSLMCFYTKREYKVQCPKVKQQEK